MSCPEIVDKIIFSTLEWEELFQICYENNYEPRTLMKDVTYFKVPKDNITSKTLALELYKANYLWRSEKDII